MTLRDGRCLFLGTCDVDAHYTGQPHEKAEEDEVVIIGCKGHKIWDTKIMSGAVLTSIPLMHTAGTAS